MSTAVCPAWGATLGGPHPAGWAPLPAAQPAPGGGGRASPPVPRPLRGQCGGCGCGGRQPAPSDVPTERVRPAHPGSLVFPWPPSTCGQCPGPGCPPRRQRRGLVPHLSSPGGGDPACSPRGRFCRAAALGQWQRRVTPPQLPQTQTRADPRPCQRGAAPPGPEGTGVSGCPGPLASQRGGARRAPHRRRCSLACSAVASPRGHPPTDTGAPSHVPLPRPRAPDFFLHSAI